MEYDAHNMKMAFNVAMFSNDQETKVGCEIFDKNGWWISSGFNHTVGENCPTTRPEKYRFMVHSEISALVSMFTPGGVVMYVTHSPCHECCKAIIAAEIKQVYYAIEHGNCAENVAFLERFGVEVRKVSYEIPV